MIWRYLWRQIHNRGYRLVSHDHWQDIQRMAHRQSVSSQYDLERAGQLSDAHNRILELEAEIEAHKRVNEALALRYLEAKHP